MTLDCILVNPPDNFTRYPYLGILQIASVLRNNGISVAIIDSSAMQLSTTEVVSKIIEMKPKVVGITIMSVNLPSSYQLISELKNQQEEFTIVAGGAHINAAPESIIEMNIEYGMHGECDYVFLEFMKTIIRGEIPNPMGGLIINRSGELIIREPALVADLDQLPIPAYDLLSLDLYYSPSTGRKAISYIMSRGCPYNCIFCSKLQKKKYRHLTPEKIVSDIEYIINKYNIGWIEFVDEIFTLKREHIEDLCNLILLKGLKFEWGCGTRVDRLDEDLIKLMKLAGCRKIGFGVESGVERIRSILHKNISNSEYIHKNSLCQKYGIITQTSFILGTPTETIDEMRESIRFAQKLRSNTPRFFRMLPIPGSELFELLKEQGEIESDAWTKYMLGLIPLPLYTPKGVSSKDIEKLLRLSWYKIYLNPKNFINNLKIIKSFDHLKIIIKLHINYCFRMY